MPLTDDLLISTLIEVSGLVNVNKSYRLVLFTSYLPTKRPVATSIWRFFQKSASQDLGMCFFGYTVVFSNWNVYDIRGEQNSRVTTASARKSSRTSNHTNLSAFFC